MLFPEAKGRKQVAAREQQAGGIGALQLFSLAFGVAIGVGWIVVLGGWLRDAGPFGGVLAFAIAALFMLAIGRAYAALAMEFPIPGGEFAYAREVFGSGIGYWAGWFLALAYISVIAFEMVSIAWIVRELFGSVVPPPDAYGHLDIAGVAIGGTALLGVVLLGSAGSGSSARAQDAMVILKVALSILLIAGGLIGGNVGNLQPFWGSHPDGAARGVLAVFATAPFFFAGFGAVAQAIGEVRSSESIKLMPRVMTAVIVGTGLFYSLIILSASLATPRGNLLSASLPAVAAYTDAFGSPLVGNAVLLLGLLGVLTILNGVFFACARLIAALANDRLLPIALAGSNSRGAPVAAGLFVALLALALTMAGQAAITPFLNVASAAISAVMAVACITLIAIRRRQGKRGILGPFVGALLATTMAVVPLYAAAETEGFSLEWAVVIGWGLIGLGCWYFARSRMPEDRRIKKHI